MIEAGELNHQHSRSAADRPTLEQIWHWLTKVPDPEIPVVSVVDLGIIRNIAWSEADAASSDPESAECIVTVTPTYSGCPATEVIGKQIVEALERHGIPHVRLKIQLSPAWTTDWLTETARKKLHAYGIAPPIGEALASGTRTGAGFVVLSQRTIPAPPACPRCGSTHTETISQFGSTPCKSLHRCIDCLEPFDHFKCH